MNGRRKLIFTVSVLLNIILIGVGAGMFYKMCQDVPIPGDISPESQHFIAKTFQDGRDSVKPLFKQAREQREMVEDILTADDFNEAAYKKAVDDFLDTRQKITRSRADVMEKAVVKLPTEDRKKFAKRVLESLEGNRPRKKGGYHHKAMKDGAVKLEDRPK